MTATASRLNAGLYWQANRKFVVQVSPDKPGPGAEPLAYGKAIEAVKGIPLFPRVIVWDPITNIPYVLFVNGNDRAIEALRQWIDLGQDVERMEVDELELLRQMGLVMAREDWIERTREFTRQVLQARSDLTERGYARVEGLFPLDVGTHWLAYYRHLMAENQMKEGDAQDRQRMIGHNLRLPRLLHDGLAELLGRIVPEPIKPSYCYSAVYRPGSELPWHTDRPQCRWNLSLTMGTWPRVAQHDDAWPIVVKRADGGTSNIVVGVGGAIIYRGDRVPHYRPKLPPEYTGYAICFFHFVHRDFAGDLR
jgi:hypothetical protein